MNLDNVRIIEITLAAAIGAAAMYTFTKRKRPRMRKRLQHFQLLQNGTQIPICLPPVAVVTIHHSGSEKLQAKSTGLGQGEANTTRD